jgi:hypothetical protein
LVWEHQWWGDSTCTVDLALLDYLRLNLLLLV